MEQVEQQYEALNNRLMEFHFSPDFEVLQAENNPPLPKRRRSGLGKELGGPHAIYTHCDGLKLEWTHADPAIRGCIDLQPVDRLLEDQWADMVTEVVGATADLTRFRVFDFYSPQNYVGLFLGDTTNTGLFYVRELDAFRLKLDMDGYFVLSAMTMGLQHWPSMVAESVHGISLSEARGLEQQLEVVPGFELAEFRATLEALQIE